MLTSKENAMDIVLYVNLLTYSDNFQAIQLKQRELHYLNTNEG